MPLSPPSGRSVYTKTLRKPGPVLERPARELLLCLPDGTHRQRLRERSVTSSCHYSAARHLRLHDETLVPDLLPPSGLHVVRVEEEEVELRWDEPEPSHSLVSGFAVAYAPLGWSTYTTDYLERKQSVHVLRGLVPGLLYNISTVSIKRNTNSTDSSRAATALIRTREHRPVCLSACEFPCVSACLCSAQGRGAWRSCRWPTCRPLRCG